MSLPFSDLPDKEFNQIFPTEGTEYKGHSYLNGSWYLVDICDANGNLYDEYADNYGRWHRIDESSIDDSSVFMKTHEAYLIDFFGL